MKEKNKTRHKNLKLKHAFTLIEVIVIMAVIGILTLLALPKFEGYTQKAKQAEIASNTRNVEQASEMYFMHNNDWPRLTDEPYTSEQIEAFARKIKDKTGRDITLDPNGKYYDIDFDKISPYVKVNDDHQNYILQNPVGKVFYLDEINKEGASRLDEGYKELTKPKAVITHTPKIITEGAEIVWSYDDSIAKDGTYIVDGEWKGNENSFTTPGTYNVSLRVKNNLGFWSEWITKEVTVVELVKNKTFTSNSSFTIPVSGWYSIETVGGRGGGPGSYGGQVVAKVYLNEGQLLSIRIGQKGGDGQYGGGSGTYRYRAGSGGGGSSAVIANGALLIEAKGGNGSYGFQNAYKDYIGMGKEGAGGSGYTPGKRAGGSLPTNHLPGAGGGSNRIGTGVTKVTDVSVSNKNGIVVINGIME